MSEKIYIRLRTLFVTGLFLVIAVVIHAVNLEPRPWDCGSAEKSIAGLHYVIELCDIDGGPDSQLNDARLRVYNGAGALLAQRHYFFEPRSRRNSFVVRVHAIEYTNAGLQTADGAFEVQTLAFPPTSADWRAANFSRLFFDR